MCDFNLYQTINRILKIGLTGGIGCGKSTVVQLFAEAGWRTIETDEVVRECLASDAVVHAALRERWGDAVFDADGAVQTRPADWRESSFQVAG